MFKGVKGVKGVRGVNAFYNINLLNMKTSSHKELLIWNKSFELRIILYKLVKEFPKIEQYALGDQMRRCIISIPSNIAEGHSRASNKEFIHFLTISRGSLAELLTQIEFAIELEYLDRKTGDDIIYKYNGIDLMIVNLIKSLRKDSNFFKTLKSFLFSIIA